MKMHLSFTQVLDVLRDGHGYAFGHRNLKGCFYKAPYPAQDSHTERDGAASAITFWRNGERAMPTLMLYDFDEPKWWVARYTDWPQQFIQEIDDVKANHNDD